MITDSKRELILDELEEVNWLIGSLSYLETKNLNIQITPTNDNIYHYFKTYTHILRLVFEDENTFTIQCMCDDKIFKSVELLPHPKGLEKDIEKLRYRIYKSPSKTYWHCIQHLYFHDTNYSYHFDYIPLAEALLRTRSASEIKDMNIENKEMTQYKRINGSKDDYVDSYTKHFINKDACPNCTKWLSNNNIRIPNLNIIHMKGRRSYFNKSLNDFLFK